MTRLRARASNRLFTPLMLAGTLVVVFLVAYPIIRLVERGVRDMGVSGLVRMVQQPWFGPLLRDTFLVTMIASVLAVVIATLLAWLNERTDATLGVVGSVLPLIPLFLPAVALAIGWVMLAAPRSGFVNGLLSLLPGHIELNIYSFPGLVFVYVLTLVPYAYLPISAAFRSIDLSREEAARVCGAGNVRVFFTVALRSVMPAVAGSFVLVAIVAFALYSVPVVLATRAQIDIVAVRLVRSITQSYPTDYNTAIGLSVFLFAVLMVLWLFQQKTISEGRFTKVGERTEGASRTRLGGWKWVGRGMMLLYILASSILPIGAMLLVSFQAYWDPDIFGARYTMSNYTDVLSTNISRSALENSLILGITVGAVTVAAGLLIIVYKQHQRGWLAKVVDGIAKIPGVISNTVLGVAFILAFAGPPFNFGSTVWIIVIGYLVVFIPYAVISLEGSRAQISDSLTEAAAVNGAWEWRTIRTVVLPLMVPGIASALALLFVLMTGDLALAVLLATPRTPVIGLVLLDYWEQGSFTSVAVLSVLMTAIAAIVVAALLLLARPRYVRRNR